MSDYAHLLESLRGGGLTIAQSAVPVAHTGTATKTTLATITVPPGMMGSNGSVEVEAYWSNDNTANDKTLGLELNAAGGLTSLATTGVAHITRWVIMNKNATNAQHVYREEVSAAAVVPSATTDAEDTTAALVLTITGTLETDSETMTLLSYTARATQR
jgi:hypothetical protein